MRRTPRTPYATPGPPTPRPHPPASPRDEAFAKLLGKELYPNQVTCPSQGTWKVASLDGDVTITHYGQGHFKVELMPLEEELVTTSAKEVASRVLEIMDAI